MKNIPNKIYLQIGEDADITIDNSVNDFNDLYRGAITWNDERINENDIEYERKKDAALPIHGVSKSLPDEEYEPYFGWCDVDGCENEGCSGGNAWKNTGYWTVCYKHSDDFRNGLEQPKMKQTAVQRESKRDPITGWLSQ